MFKRFTLTIAALGCAATVALAGCGGSSAKTSSASPAKPASTAQQLSAWYDDIKPDFNALKAGFKTFQGSEADCLALLTNAQTLQDDPPAPVPSVNAPWQSALAAYARAGLECSSGVKNNDDSQIQAATSDVDAADGFMKQATANLS